MSASAFITVGATYGINVYLTPAGAVTAAGIKAGDTMLPGTLQEDGSYKVVAATVYARNKNMIRAIFAIGQAAAYNI